MKQLTCEMCGSTDLIKQDGFFVCQSCGTKYSVEEAKKMMIEGTVEVQGTVKVDDTSKINNYLALAESAWESNDIKSAVMYTDKVLEIDVNNYKAWSIRAKTVGWGSTLADKKVTQSIVAAKKAIELTPDEEKTKVADELVLALAFQVIGMYQLALKVQAISIIQGPQHAHAIMLDWLDVLKLPHVSKEAIRSQISVCEQMYNESKSASNHVARCMYAASAAFNNNESYHITFKKALLPDELTELEKQPPKKSGCYVATCVYGSYDCPEVWTLRRYRDDTLGATWYGRAFIRTYYAISPTLVKWFGKTKWFKKMWKGKLDKMVKKLQDNGVENTPYEDKDWSK